MNKSLEPQANPANVFVKDKLCQMVLFQRRNPPLLQILDISTKP